MHIKSFISQNIIRVGILDGTYYFKVLAKMWNEMASNISFSRIPLGYIPTVFIKSKQHFSTAPQWISISVHKFNVNAVRPERNNFLKMK